MNLQNHQNPDSLKPEQTKLPLKQTIPDEYQPVYTEPLRLADLILYPETYEAYRGQEKIHLRRKEYQLLEFLMRNQHRVINRHTLLEYIWNYNTDAVTNTLDVHMSSLRKKVDGKKSRKIIRTIHGLGYKLSDR